MSIGSYGARIHEHGDLDQVVVESFEIGDPAPGQVRVRLRAAALNHLDLFVLEGIPGIEMPLPHVMGGDGAGVIDAVGEGVTGWAAGDEVVLNPGLWCGACSACLSGEQNMCSRYQLLGEHVDGTFARHVLVPQANCHVKPDGLDWHHAAAFPLATLTAWRMILTNGRVKPGDTVLIHGIGGGVSLVAMQIALAAGARVYVTSHSEAKLARARELGAREAWNYRELDISREVRRATSRRGVDLVVDNVGQATFATSIKSVRKGGAIVTCGGTSGPDLPVDVRYLFWNHVRILGSTMGSEPDFRSMVRAVANGAIVPIVDSVYPLEAAAEALGHLRGARQFGKVVLEIE